MGLYGSEYQEYEHFAQQQGNDDYVSGCSDPASEAVEAWEPASGPVEAV
jgi:hypothetical protein